MASSGSIFKLHHTFELQYPCDLVRGGTEHEHFLPPKDVATRHEPQPLIADTAVARNASRQNVSENSFISTKVTNSNLAKHHISASPGPSDSRRLRFDMYSLSRCPGRTTLGFVLLSDDFVCLMIRFRRTTVLRLDRGQTRQEIVEYTMSKEIFLSHGLEEDWEKDCLALIEGSNDRAVRHAMAQLEGGYPKLNWLPRPELDMRLALAQVTHLVKEPQRSELIQLKEECPICILKYCDVEEVFLTKACKHMFCNECLLSWANSGKNRTTCPNCRHPMFRNVDNKKIKFGIGRDDNYEFDERYNDWENFERSCADLDATLAVNDNTSKITISRMAVMAWNHFLSKAEGEPGTSTEKSQNLAFTEEMQLVDWSVRTTLGSSEGFTDTPAALFKYLKCDLEAALYSKFANSEVASLVTKAELENIRKDISYERLVDLRPDFMPFVERLLNRTLNAMTMRRCECCPGWVRGRHFHGKVRMYFKR